MVDVTLETILEDALDILYRAQARPLQTLITADTLTASAADTTVGLDDPATINENDILEHGQEQMLVTAKSNDALPVITIARGYNNTPILAGATGDVVLRSPLWSRYGLKKAVLRGLQRTIPNIVPNLVTEEYDPTGNSVELPADTMQVKQVAWFDTQFKDWTHLNAWSYEPNVGSSSTTGQLLTVHPSVQWWPGGTLQVTRQAPYRWVLSDAAPEDDPVSDPGTDEAAVVSLTEAAVDLPSKFAAAYVVGNREVSRIQLETVEEWSQEAAIRNGVNLRLLAQQWNDFYRACDEARRTIVVPRPIIFRRRGKF